MLLGGKPTIYFSTWNTAARTIAVPAEYPDLNTIYSRTGKSLPLRSFPAGAGGFALPQTDFNFPNGLYGLWTFLGQEILVNNSLPICADMGLAEQCTRLDPALFRAPLDYTRDSESENALYGIRMYEGFSPSTMTLDSCNGYATSSHHRSSRPAQDLSRS
jgi:hypothetical protein